jgi:hypothetical protein
MDKEYIYIVQLKRFIKCNTNIYTIGRTSTVLINKINQYPNESLLIFRCPVNNSIFIENIIIQKFNMKFKKMPEFGKEYYEGNLNLMVKEIMDIIYEYNNNININDNNIGNINDINNNDINNNDITSKKINKEYVYIIYTREFIRSKENVYKIGKTTTTPINRFNQYARGSLLIFTHPVNNCTFIEKIIIKNFDLKFKKMLDYGNEYYEGDLNLMVNEIINIIREHNNYDSNNYDDINNNDINNLFSTLDQNYIVFENHIISVIIDNNDNIWFNANDVAKSLEYKDIKDAIKQHVERKYTMQIKNIDTNIKIKGQPASLYLNESGLYSFMLSSKLPKAKKFKNWIIKDILPSIRKYKDEK